MSVELADQLRARALELGFARVGVASVEALSPERDYLDDWLARGCHGEMDYMRRTAEVRIDPRHEGMLPTTRSVLVFATPYARAQEGPVGLEPGKVARYARGRDYHNVLHKRLKQLTRMLRDAGHDARGGVDSLPVMERAWAQRAGLGFIGKNACLIIPGLGSHLFLSAIVTSAELPPDAPMKERCGSCTRCLDGCPTDAFDGPRRLDARRCISYLTIEHRGVIDPELRGRMDDWLFGCDACQDVCPFNATAPEAADRTAAFAPHARLQQPADALLRMDEAAFAEFAQGSPLKRPGRVGMARNAAIVLGNAGGRRALPVLREAAEHDASPVVRDAAQWALQKLQSE